MSSFLKGLKDKLLDSFDAPELTSRRDHQRGLGRSIPRRRNRTRDHSRKAKSLSLDIQEAVTISEPYVGTTRKNRAKEGEWDNIYDNPRRRYTDISHNTTHKEWKLPGGFTLLKESRSQKSSPRNSFASPKSSQDHVRIHDPKRSRGLFASHWSSRDDARQSRDHHSTSPPRFRGRDTSLRRSTYHHYRRRRKSSHYKELSRHQSHGEDSSLSLIPPVPPTPQTNILKLNKQPLGDRLRYKEAERLKFKKKKERLRLDHEKRKRLGKEWKEKQCEKAARAAAKAAMVAVEETARRQRERITRETENMERERRAAAEERRDRERRSEGKVSNASRGRMDVAPVRNLLRLTAEILRAVAGGRDGGEEEMDGDSVKSELNRVIGDMNRTFLEGMVPAEEVEEAERRQREKWARLRRENLNRVEN